MGNARCTNKIAVTVDSSNPSRHNAGDSVVGFGIWTDDGIPSDDNKDVPNDNNGDILDDNDKDVPDDNKDVLGNDDSPANDDNEEEDPLVNDLGLGDEDGDEDKLSRSDEFIMTSNGVDRIVLDAKAKSPVTVQVLVGKSQIT